MGCYRGNSGFGPVDSIWRTNDLCVQGCPVGPVFKNGICLISNKILSVLVQLPNSASV